MGFRFNASRNRNHSLYSHITLITCRNSSHDDIAFQRSLLRRYQLSLNASTLSAWLFVNEERSSAPLDRRHHLIVGTTKKGKGPMLPCLSLRSLRKCLNQDPKSPAQGCLGKHDSSKFFNRWFFSQLVHKLELQLVDEVTIKGPRGCSDRCQALIFPPGTSLDPRSLSEWLRLQDQLQPVERGEPLQKKPKVAGDSSTPVSIVPHKPPLSKRILLVLLDCNFWQVLRSRES